MYNTYELKNAYSFILNSEFEKAYEYLKNIKDRCASWYYLNSISCMELGYYKEGNDSIKEAMNDSNFDEVLKNYNFNNYNNNYDYRNRANAYRRKKVDFDCCCCCGDCCCCCDDCCCPGDDCCENLGKLWVLDSMCECCGGDICDCM